VEHGFALSNQKMTPEYRNYLMDCHYTDQQLEKYIDVLKKNGIYDKSVIVIAADHHAHPSMFDMEEGDISQELPLYVINGGIDMSEAWTGPCNQLDVYTTLLDMFGVKTKWHGLGHTLLKSDYINSVSDNTQRLSDWIVRGNYFKDR
jgi:lipoteichoic acid synthase